MRPRLTPPTNCPACNSVQKFPVKKRRVDGRIQKYIRCNTCREEIVLGNLPGKIFR